mmetsp:Transcript_23669/g.42544  ORF Transcript_23669/g.42544 Transcript_23669/m.42544 type:complete len:229 (+) Transcript_23669:475-1161(+)
MNEQLYNIANEAPSPNNNNHRKQYTLGSVAVTGGGLKNSDRTLLADLYRNASSVFEYGLGESTHIAAYVGVPRLAGVDSDAAWVAEARDGSPDRFRFAFADVGALGPLYGQPKNESLAKIPYDYQSGPLNNERGAFDLYLVDGRYRVATACASFLHAMSRGGDMEEVRVLFHDWNRGNPGNWNWEYWAMEDIADVVRESELLAVLKLKSNARESDIVKLWEKYMWDRR